MIQIDDAGWGSLVGGCLIGACRVESPQTQHAFREVPVASLQGESFDEKQYLGLAALAAVELLDELEVTIDEPIHICTGYVLCTAAATLTDMGYQVTSTKIGEPLQTLIETELLNRIRALGIETDLETITTKQGLYFYQCLKWLKGGDLNGKALPEREKMVKTGWATYRIWADNPYYKAKIMAREFKSVRRRGRWNRREW